MTKMGLVVCRVDTTAFDAHDSSGVSRELLSTNDILVKLGLKVTFNKEKRIAHDHERSIHVVLTPHGIRLVFDSDVVPFR